MERITCTHPAIFFLHVYSGINHVMQLRKVIKLMKKKRLCIRISSTIFIYHVVNEFKPSRNISSFENFAELETR